MTIFVDGYNLIFAASRRFPEFDTNRPDAARERLLELLSHHKLMTSDRIVVFFDGGPEAAHLPRRQMVRGLDVFFSEANSDADTDIKNAVSHDGNPSIIRVVTSDVGIQNFVRRYGVSVTDSVEYLDEIEETRKEDSPPSDEPIEKYEGGVGDDKGYWMRIFGDEEPEQ